MAAASHVTEVGAVAESPAVGRPPWPHVVTGRPPLVDEVVAPTSRYGLRQVDRHALQRRVEAHQGARGHQHQQHQRQVLDRRLTPLHALHGMDATVTCA